MLRQPSTVALAVAAVLAVVLAGAWGFEIIADLAPCPLCLQQRWPYYAGIPLALGVAVMAGQGANPGAITLGLGVLAVLLAGSAAFGAFHAGVEWGFWQGPTDCAGGRPITGNAADLLAQIARTRVVACDQAAFRFLGLSLAGYNALISAGLCGLVVRALAAHGSSSVSQ
jgi:disulfide bond formation protein DsbB